MYEVNDNLGFFVVKFTFIFLSTRLICKLNKFLVQCVQIKQKQKLENDRVALCINSFIRFQGLWVLPPGSTRPALPTLKSGLNRMGVDGILEFFVMLFC